MNCEMCKFRLVIVINREYFYGYYYYYYDYFYLCNIFEYSYFVVDLYVELK